jgi:hypothetical protein
VQRHHLREFKALIKIEREVWVRMMHRLLRRACHAVNLARERGSPLEPSLIALVERRYDAILAEGLAFQYASGEDHTPVQPGARFVVLRRKGLRRHAAMVFNPALATRGL